MHIEFLVEEPSMEAALQNLLPQMLPQGSVFNIVTFQGKFDLLRKLPDRLRGYSSWIPENYRIVILIDEDRQNCHELKNQLESICYQSGLTTKTRNVGSGFQVLNRIVIEELESWFIGDDNALQQAYTRLPNSIAHMRKFRDPDSVAGGTWESLAKLMKQYGYYQGGYPKVQAARKISGFMIPEINRSRSFQVFREGLLALE